MPLPLGLEGTWEISALTKFLTCVVHILQRLLLCVSNMKGGLTHLQSRSVAKAWLSPASAWLRCRLSMVGLRPVTVPLIRKWQICISNGRHNTHTTQMISQSQRGPRDHTGSRNWEMQAWECSPTCPSDFHSFFFFRFERLKEFQLGKRTGYKLITEDTALCFVALNGLPGPYINYFMTQIGHEGLNAMLVWFPTKAAEAVCTRPLHTTIVLAYY